MTSSHIGSWCSIGHPAIAEILARAGFQWLALDCEHGEVSSSDIANFCRACRLHGTDPYVRVKNNDLLVIRRALDLGANGVIVPLVNSTAEAEKAVAAALYPPAGIRGFAWSRGNNWGADFDSYSAEFKPRVIVMIESKEAVAEIDSIMAVEGTTGCMIGPYDLSGSYGIPGKVDDPLVQTACLQVAKAAVKAGKMAGLHIVTPTPERFALAYDQGYRFFALGVDSWFLREGAATALSCLKGEKTDVQQIAKNNFMTTSPP